MIETNEYYVVKLFSMKFNEIDGKDIREVIGLKSTTEWNIIAEDRIEKARESLFDMWKIFSLELKLFQKENKII